MGDTRSFNDLVAETGKLRSDLEDFKTTAMGRFPSSARAIGQPVRSTGATAATRYVGGTATGAPTTGTHAVGDFIVSQDGAIWICTTAGTPGTWRRSASANHHWFRSTDHNVSDGVEKKLDTWTIVNDGGLVTQSSGDFTLNVPGRWAFKLDISSDTTTAGNWRVYIDWPSGAFGVNFLEETVYRGAGFSWAGYLRTNLDWVGWVSSSAAANPLSCSVYWLASDGSTQSTVLNQQLDLNYLGYI